MSSESRSRCCRRRGDRPPVVHCDQRDCPGDRQLTSRRDFLAGLAAVLAFAPLRALAQVPGKTRRIAVLVSARREDVLQNLAHLDKGLRDLGLVEGRNLSVEWRFADGDYGRLPGLARELVALGVELLVSFGGSATALAAQKATATIPIVFVNVGDPVAIGLVESLAHPDRNATGYTNLSADTEIKHLEMLRSVVPGLSRVAVLFNPANPASPRLLAAVNTAALETRMKLLPLEAGTSKQISEAFRRIATDRPGAVIVGGDAFLYQQRGQIAEGAAALRLPSIGAHVGYAEAGGLLSYGANPAESFQRAASFVDKILKGARPGDLPVEQPTRLQLVVNRKTAKAIGVAVPAELLVLADRVIE